MQEYDTSRHERVIRDVSRTVTDAVVKGTDEAVSVAVARGLELEVGSAEHTDLDHLIGSWQEDPAFDRAVADFGCIDADAWP